MVRTVDVTAPSLLGWLREPRQAVEAYGRTKGEIEKAVGTFSDSLGGPRRIGRSPLWEKLGLGLGVLAFFVASSALEPPYQTYAIAVAIVLVVASATLSNRTLFLPAGLASGRAPLEGRIAYYGGGGLSVLGFATCFAAIFSMQEDGSWMGWAAFAAGMVAAAAGALIGRRGKQLLQPTANELTAHDARRPIVLLRSFADDDLMVVTGRSKEGLTTGDFEESIEDQFAPFGPFVAIGKPGEPLPALGAARDYYSDAEWQDAVAKWMDEALALVVIPGLTGGLGWELETIRQYGHFDKLLVLMPPRIEAAQTQNWSQFGVSLGSNWNWTYSSSGGGWRRTADVVAEEQESIGKRWDILRAAFADIEAFRTLPEDEPPGLIGMHLTSDGEPVLLTGPTLAWEGDYERAIRYALYGMFCHGRIEESQAPSPHADSGAPRLATD